MFCEKCGHQIPEDSSFCDNCGCKISGNIPPVNVVPDNNNDKANKHNRKVLYIVLGVIAILVIIGIFSDSSNNSSSTSEQPNNSSTETWKEFNSVGGNFKTLFPTFPEHKTEPLNIAGITNQINMEEYTSVQGDGTTYLVYYTAYSSEVDTSNPRTNLENSVNGILQTLENGKLTSSSFSKFGNYDAIDYLLYSPKEDVYIKGKNMMVGKSLYAIAVSYEQKNSSNAQYDKFVNSFQFTSNSTTPANQNTQIQSSTIDPVAQADYSEGYKSGYVDGRSSKGQLGDNYAEPATEERKSAYLIGYLDGFLKGCREGNFDCSAVENAINNLGKDSSTNVNLIPPSVN